MKTSSLRAQAKDAVEEFDVSRSHTIDFYGRKNTLFIQLEYGMVCTNLVSRASFLFISKIGNSREKTLFLLPSNFEYKEKSRLGMYCTYCLMFEPNIQ